MKDNRVVTSPPVMPKVPNRNRLTIVETIYFQDVSSMAGPTALESKFTRLLETDEQPYGPRKIKVTEEWKQLETGWIDEVGMMVITNEEGKHYQVYPTEEEKLATAKKIVEISFSNCTEKFLIPPGESFRGMPGNLKRILVRCQSGIANCLLLLIPK